MCRFQFRHSGFRPFLSSEDIAGMSCRGERETLITTEKDSVRLEGAGLGDFPLRISGDKRYSCRAQSDEPYKCISFARNGAHDVRDLLASFIRPESE